MTGSSTTAVPFLALVLFSALGLILSSQSYAAEAHGDAEAARIEQAVQAYAAQLKADAQTAADARVASRVMDVLQDLGTPVLGNPNGDVAIVEFFDYQCSFCKAAEPRLRRLVETDGNIRHVIKDFPILGPVSMVAAKAALASIAQGKHEAFHHGMMDHRGQLTEERIWKIAENVGLDVARLQTDMNAPDITDQLMANFNLARKLRVVVVPGLIVNTHMLSGLTAETMTADIDFGKEVAAARAGQM